MEHYKREAERIVMPKNRQQRRKLQRMADKLGRKHGIVDVPTFSDVTIK